MNLRLFGKNAVIYAVGSMALRGVSFLLIPLYTHALSLSEYGMLATILLTIQILITLIDIGIRSGIIRFQTQYEKENLPGTFLGSAVLLNLIGGGVVTFITVLFFKPVFRIVLHLESVTEIIVLTCLAAVAQSLCVNIMTHYRARNEGMKYMIANGAVAVLLMIANIIFLLILKEGIRGILWALITTYGAAWLIISLTIFMKIGFRVSINVMRQLFVFGFPLIFAMSGDLITGTTAVYFLSYFSNLEVVAIYSLGLKIAQIAGVILIIPFQMAYEPFVFANIGQSGIRETISKLVTYLMLAFTFVGFGIVFVFKDLIFLMAPAEYAPAYNIVFLLLPGIALMGIQYVGQSLLHIKNKTHVTGIVITGVTLISVILNYFFIQAWGMYGVVIVFMFANLASALILLMLGMKQFPIHLEKRRLAQVMSIFTFLMFAVFYFQNTSQIVYYSFFPFLAGIILFILFVKFFENGEKDMIKSLIHNKMG
ncbi:MAG: lipopolysaccharide biosynthesis protein [Calditrichaceae bacterium]